MPADIVVTSIAETALSVLPLAVLAAVLRNLPVAAATLDAMV